MSTYIRLKDLRYVILADLEGPSYVHTTPNGREEDGYQEIVQKMIGTKKEHCKTKWIEKRL
jgi:hypothetical protein